MLSSVRLSVDIGFISFRFYFKSEELHISQCDLIRIIPLLFDSNRQLSTIGFFCPSLKKKYVLFLLFIITLRGEIQSISSLCFLCHGLLRNVLGHAKVAISRL